MSKLPGLLLLVTLPVCIWTPALGQSGVVKSEGQPLPGATVQATQGNRVLTTVTDPAGAFTIETMTPGAWTVDVTMFGFDTIRKEVQIGSNPAKIDFTLQLRQFAGPGGRGGAAAQNAAAASGLEAGGAQETQGQETADSGAAAAGAPAGAPQADASGANEAFLVTGSISTGLQTQSGDFNPQGGPGGLNPGGPPGGFGDGPAANLQAQPAGGVPGGGPIGGPGGGGGFAGGGGGFGGRGGGGGGGGRGGPGGRAGGRGPGGRGGGAFIGNRRNAGRSQIRGSFFYGLRDSALDASPFSLNGQTNTKASYLQNRFGFTIGGPLEIPKLVHWENTTWSINYTGSLLRNGVNLTGTVPTLAERTGDFSAFPSVIYNPVTGIPFGNNQILQPNISTIAQGLLAYIPAPNQPGTVNNYRLIAAVPNNSQSLNTRVSQTLSRRDQIGVVFNWQGRNSQNLQLYDFTDLSSGNGINGSLTWRHNFGSGMLNNLAATFNRNTSLSTPFFADGTNVAALLGIQGTSTNPINFGPPNLSFTNFSALSDGSPSQSAVYSFGFTDTFSYRKGKHNWSFGAGYTRYYNNTITDSNGRGTFTFTGLSTSAFDANGNAVTGTGLDLADFLLGLPQSNSIRFGSSSTYFRTNSYNAFGQDDWRARANLTLNLGLRYEYFAPWQEKYGRIANLDIAPGFTAVSVVTPSQPGLYSGSFPAGLINPDRNNFAPRAGLAWKPSAKSKITVRLGYGWYYNPGVYNQFMSRLSAQPPFAQSTTVDTSLDNPLTLATGLSVTPDGKTITNTFAVDRNYRDMYAQSWNVTLQSDLPGALVGQIAYLGTKGTRLDVQVSPNQAPPGSQLTAEQRLAIGNATGFVYDTPVGNSIYHALQARVARRFRRGFSGTVQYTFAKSIDDSSTLGGAGNTVAQNFYDLSAERGLSSFDRRHNLTVNYVWSSLVGNNGFLANKGVLTTALKDWTVNGSVTLQSGTPLTARVLGNQSDTAGTGNFGSSRASATGLPVDSGSGFFNLLAFTTPVAGQYGDAGRNTITGPGIFSMNFSLQRVVPLTERMRLQIQASANNVTNHVNITSFGTVVNSQTYGVATGAGGMRNLTLTLRFNF